MSCPCCLRDSDLVFQITSLTTLYSSCEPIHSQTIGIRCCSYDERISSIPSTHKKHAYEIRKIGLRYTGVLNPSSSLLPYLRYANERNLRTSQATVSQTYDPLSNLIIGVLVLSHELHYYCYTKTRSKEVVKELRQTSFSITPELSLGVLVTWHHTEHHPAQSPSCLLECTI